MGEGIPSCEELKGSVRTEGCLQYSCSTGSMKIEMLEKCKELINAEVQKIVKKRLEECKEVPALFVGPSQYSGKTEIILLPPQSSNYSTPNFPVAGINGYLMFS